MEELQLKAEERTELLRTIFFAIEQQGTADDMAVTVAGAVSLGAG